MTTQTVLKQMSITELKDLLRPAETMDRFSFDPRSGEGKFVLEDGKMEFRLGDSSYFMTSDAYLRVSQMLGVPEAYVRRSPHEVILPGLNYWLENNHRGRNTFMTFASDNGVIQFFGKGENEPVLNDTILTAIGNRIGDDLAVHHISHNYFDTRYSITSPRFEEAVKVGDPIRIGINIQNSYANLTPLTVSAYVHRLSCTNGAVSTDTVMKLTHRGGGGPDDYEAWSRDAVNFVFDHANREFDRLKTMNQIKVSDHISSMLQGIYTEYKVPVRAQKEITDYVIDNQVETLFDLYNAVTYIASNSDTFSDDPKMVDHLMKIGGRIACHPEICFSCFRVMQ